MSRTWVMAGAGNAHLKALRMAAMKPPSELDFVLVNRTSRVVYSAMIPLWLAGDAARSDIEIDLPAFCQANGFRFVLGELSGLERTERHLLLQGRAPLTFDFLSLSLGSVADFPEGLGEFPGVIGLKPLERLVENLDREVLPRKDKVVFVGGGASACELALALRKRCGMDREIELIFAGERVVANYPPQAQRHIESALRRARISLRRSSRVIGARDHELSLENGESVAFGTCILATQGQPTPILEWLGLPRDDQGFLKVDRTLQSGSDIYAAGDCVSIEGLESLPRNGVHAVRQGETLFTNIVALARGETTRPYTPQKRTLNLFNCADGNAVLSYGKHSTRGRWALRWKTRIDQGWRQGFRGEMGASAAMDPMRCGGCGSKVPSSVLSGVLKEIRFPNNPDILKGHQDGEDVAIHRPPAGQLEVQTVDFFQAFVDEPRLFGALTAIHALSDIQAANAKPFSALALCTIPAGNLLQQQQALGEMLKGACAVFERHGTTLTGGHTTEGERLGLGFAITGYAAEGSLFQKRALKPGDTLVLTKAIGSGALLASLMRETGASEWFRVLFQQMSLSNARAANIFAQHGVRACTDVTGFGLAGHLKEMLTGDLVASLDARAVPLLPGFDETTAQGIFSTLHPANQKDHRVSAAEELPWLYDPQTCGGLLAGVSANEAERVVQVLREAGYWAATIIGSVHTAEQPNRLNIRK